MTAVWAHSPASGTDLLVLLALADIADDDGECWPSVGYIARKCRIDARTTQRRIRHLQELGEVLVIERGGMTRIPGATPSNRYRITIHMPDEGEGGNLPEGGTSVRGRVAPAPGGRVAPAPPNTSEETSVEPSKTIAADEFADLWDEYPGGKVDRKKAHRQYIARLKAGVSHGDLIAAVRNYARFIETTGQYVKHCATFLGPDEPYADFVAGIPAGALRVHSPQRAGECSASAKARARVLAGINPQSIDRPELTA